MSESSTIPTSEKKKYYPPGRSGRYLKAFDIIENLRAQAEHRQKLAVENAVRSALRSDRSAEEVVNDILQSSAFSQNPCTQFDRVIAALKAYPEPIN